MILLFALLLEITALSGRVAGFGESPSERLSPPRLIAPGAPPVLSFRYFDANDRGRFGNLGLMTDDAGH
ncbi:MAG TPA: hypothetical protein VK752_14520 [Bryobacteraceae bacterium]|jgi:hypothetical protein|nr:hypothetical protein [Bryobacteraceae bacterium]